MIQIKIGFVKKLISDRDSYSAVLWVSHNDEFPPLEGGSNVLRVQDNSPFPYKRINILVNITPVESIESTDLSFHIDFKEV